MADLEPFAALVPLDHGLSVVVTRRADRSPHTTVVNAAVIPHPTTDDRVVAFVSAGAARKLTHLRRDPVVSIVVRAGWRWAAVDGTAELIGPDDPLRGVDEERLRGLLREIFAAAGGTHDDWDEFDATMRHERRAAVLVHPVRCYTNPG